MNTEKTLPNECALCKGELVFLGQVPVRVKGSSGVSKIFFGELAELGEEMWPIDVFRCSKCGHLEMFDLDFSLKPIKKG